MQSSQRYCNYSNDKFGRDITFIEPLWDTIGDKRDNALHALQKVYKQAKDTYMYLIEDTGLKAQEAREVLPNCTMTEIYMCGDTNQ